PDDLGVAAGLDVALDGLLDRDQAQLLQPPGLGCRERLLEHAGERRSLPERERLAPALAFDELLEQQRIHPRGVDPKLLSPALREDVRVAGAVDQAPQLRDVLLDHLRRRGRRVLAPQAVDEPLERHGLVGAEREHRQHGLLLRAGQLDRMAVQLDVDGTKDADRHTRVSETTLPAPQRASTWLLPGGQSLL